MIQFNVTRENECPEILWKKKKTKGSPELLSTIVLLSQTLFSSELLATQERLFSYIIC